MKYKESVEDLKKRGISVRNYKNELKKLSSLRKSLLSELKTATDKDVIAFKEKNIAEISRKMRITETMIRKLGRKNMHQHIALCLFRGTPYNEILSNCTRKKIRPESVFEFLTEITSW